MKKILAAALVAAMTLGLVACGSNNNASSGPSSSGQTASTSEGGSAYELKGPGNVTLKRLGYNVAFDPNEDINGKVLEEVTGYQVEYGMLPAESADEKLLMEASSGNWDLINCSPSQFRTLMSQGACLPLNDLLNEYGKDIVAGNKQAIWDALTGDDGNIYGIPYMYPHSHEIATFMVCRLDLMKEAGCDTIPTTTDELYDTLKKLKAHFGNQYIPFAGPFIVPSEGNLQWVIPTTIACAFGIYNDWMVNENGEVYYITEAEKFPEMIEYLTKLYDEGLVDPDWAINTDATLKEKFSAGKTIICAANRALPDFCSQALIDNVGISWDDLGYISALKGPDGTCTYQSTENLNQVSFIPVSHPDNAADTINWCNIRINNQLLIEIGEEGKHFNYDSEGKIEPINPIFAEERGNSYWYNDTTNQEDFEFQWPARVRKSAGQWHAFSAVTMNADQSVFVPNYFAFMPAKENYAKYNTALFNSLQDWILQVMSGSRTINDLDTFVSDWKNNGGEEVRNDLQTWYNEFYN